MSGNGTTLVPCFVCGTTLSKVSVDGYDMQPSEGTSFATYGAYGSTFWDSFHGEELTLLICDDCLKAGTERLVRHKRYRNVRCMYFTVGRTWVNHEPVPYFDGPEDADDIEIEPEEIGVLTGFRIEWANNWEDMKTSALAMLAEQDKET